MANEVRVCAAVEGIVDEAVVRRLIEHVGAAPGPVYGKQGKAALRQKIAGYNNAARHQPWLVLVDLDRDHDCAPPLRDEWLAHPASRLCFRVAVRAVEAWLLADAERLAAFLGVAKSKIPQDPERLDDPKAAVVNLARSSRRGDIREEMVPTQQGGRDVGRAYSSRLIEFVSQRWRPEQAARSCESLRRAIECLRRVAAG
jgi:hypothetical protein